LVIKAGMYGALILIGALGFLPKLVEKHWFKGEAAHFAGWLASVFLWAAGYIAIRVIGAVFTTSLYHHAQKKNT